MAPDPTPGPAPLDLRAVADVLVEHVACDPDLAPRIGAADPRVRRRQVSDLLRCAAAVGREAHARDRVETPLGLDLDHPTFSLLASHLADVLDALGIEVGAAADLLAGLAAVRGRIVRPRIA